MNLIWLDDFLVLAASGNFSRAASARHTTQPAFSRRIRALEEWLGTELFDRSSQPAKLTDAGAWFRTVAQDLLNQVARVPGEARVVAEANSGTLRLAATHALSFTFMPLWLRSLESHTSVGPIRLVSDVLTQCEALMLQGQVQFVLSHAHVHAQGQLDVARYPSIRIGQDQLLPVSATDASGAPMHTLGCSKSTPVSLLNYNAESGIGRILHKVHGGALGRLPVQIVFTAHLASVLRTMVLDGRGLAWLPRTLIADDLASGRLVNAGAAKWNVALDIRLYRERASISDPAQSFWQAAFSSGDTPEGQALRQG